MIPRKEKKSLEGFQKRWYTVYHSTQLVGFLTFREHASDGRRKRRRTGKLRNTPERIINTTTSNLRSGGGSGRVMLLRSCRKKN